MRLRFPHPLLLLLGAVLVAALLTWILPAGEYQRAPDPATGRDLVVAGTYREVEARPVSLPAAVLAVPKGIVSGADVLLVILMVGGVFSMLEATGALARLVGGAVGRGGHPLVVITVVSAGFCLLGALENMYEEIVALVPVLVLLSRALGFGSITALSMCLGSAVIGAAFSPINPFGAGLALKLAELPALGGAGVRVAMTVAAFLLWVGWTWHQRSRDDVRPETAPPPLDPPTARDGVLLALAMVPFVPYVYGVLALDWGFNELSALFLVAAFVLGFAARWTLRESADRFLAGMAGMLTAGIFVGVARGISVVLTDGGIIDTIVYGLATPLAGAPPLAAALGMVPVHALLHQAVPSNSGQAALAMPIMAPLADLLGLSRQAAVVAYQLGAPLLDMITPTNGALFAMLAGAGVSIGRWLRFAVPGMLLVSVVGLVGLVLLR
ncbi:MAG: Na+/H+ antiporter NhaC family protein [Gemmatimonadales bacterium]